MKNVMYSSSILKIHLAKLIFGEIRHSNHREIYIPIIEARLYIRLPTTARQKVSQLSGKTCTTITTLPLKVVHVQGAQTSLEKGKRSCGVPGLEPSTSRLECYESVLYQLGHPTCLIIGSIFPKLVGTPCSIKGSSSLRVNCM